jgi:hypothetical protein
MRHPSTDATRSRRQAAARWPVLFIGLSMLFVAACASPAGVSTLGGSNDGESPEPTASVDPEEAMFAFTDCMREQGIDLPDPVFYGSGEGPGGGGGVIVGPPAGGDSRPPDIDPNSEEFQAAMEACSEFLEGFAGPGDGPELTEEQQQAFLDFAECMRDHGIDMPDPQIGGGGFSIEIGGGSGEDGPSTSNPGFDPMSEEFQAAEEACRHLLGDIGPQTQTETAP